MRCPGAWLVLAAAIAGCAPVNGNTTRPDEPWYRTVVEPMQSDPDRIAKFYDRLLTMKASELSVELETAREAFSKDRSDLNRLQLALLLSLPGTSFRDDNGALALLGTFAKDRNHGNSTLRPLAMWLYSGLLELRRSDEALQQQAAKLKDEQRRSEALQQKLDAILEMEMKMIEREQTLPKKK
ncbi:MAG TPA: hypothetical protein VF523_03710 [Burkholderiales bacterium]